MAPIRIGNVPEHFSSPLHIGVKRGLFKKHLVEVELVNCPGGTGEMTTKLRNNELDVAIALTEGLVANIANFGDEFRIVGTYVDAPLTWAVSAGTSSLHHSIDTLRGSTIGISRLGSGSHIMSVVMADQRGWLSEDEQGDAPFQFNVLKDFKGLRDGVNSGAADAFMWETFMTKPFHDSLEVKRIGQITTPWPAFLIAVRTELLDRDTEVIHRLLTGISESCMLFMKEHASGKSQEYVATNFHLKMEDAEKWFESVHYPSDCSMVSQEVLNHCLSTLKKARVVQSVPEHIVFADPRAASLQD